jgi:ABC-2 type transport system permease protein
VPPAAFASIVLNEARLAWRQPAGLIAGIAIAMLILVIFGEIPVFGQSSAKLGGYPPFEVYIPVLTLALCMAALFAIGLTIAAVARTAGAARGLMTAALYPMLFFSGLYYPVQLMGTAIEDISHFTPLGAVVQAIGDSWVSGQFPPAQPLLVLAGYALVFGYLAKRVFRWE